MVETRNLRRLREKFGITRRQISELSGVSEPTVFRYEQGKSKAHFLIEKKLTLVTKILEQKELKMKSDAGEKKTDVGEK